MNARRRFLFVTFLFAATPSAHAVDILPGTQPLTWDGDIAAKMVDDLHAFADGETAASVKRRARHWNRDFSSSEAYEKSIEPNRERLAKCLGLVEPRVADSFPASHLPIEMDPNTLILLYDSHEIEIVRWPVFGDVNGYAFLLPAERSAPSRGYAIVIADETLLLKPGARSHLSPTWEFAKRLRDNGCHVYLTNAVNRRVELSVVADGARPTDQSHREFIYRQAFELGRHPIGYEVERVRSLVDWMRRNEPAKPVGLFGFGEGGVVALCAGAVDPRINVIGVCGSFGPRQRLHEEPIDRNIWGLLEEFGDAELATLIAPRPLILVAGADLQHAPALAARNVKQTAAPGALKIPAPGELAAEVARAKQLMADDQAAASSIALSSHLMNHTEQASADSGLSLFLRGLGIDEPLDLPTMRHHLVGAEFSILEMMGWTSRIETALANASVAELIDHTQALMRESEHVRQDFWKNADRASRDPEKWEASCAWYRDYLYDEVLGRFDLPKLPPNARTRKIFDEPTYAGYEVVLDVFASEAETVGVFAYGILLVPNDLKPGERRPVVVCQHGLEGRPQDLTTPGLDHRSYHGFGNKLAERGFVVFAPQNPYLGKDHFRQLVRKLYPLKKTLWSVIIPQHEQITDWLATLDFVDADRIGFYGLSYGGKTAMRVPALVPRYCLSICSGDFNEWIRKCVSVREPYSYMQTHEYEMYEFDLGHTFNYAELAGLIAPRPFMVERGHRDGVGVDEWVSYEYAKVRLLYADLRIPERTEIEYFDGPHEIHGVGTFDFLRRHLNWPVATE